MGHLLLLTISLLRPKQPTWDFTKLKRMSTRWIHCLNPVQIYFRDWNAGVNIIFWIRSKIWSTVCLLYGLKWSRNAFYSTSKIADATSVIRPDTLYFGTLHFRYISELCIYIFYTETAVSMQLSAPKTLFGIIEPKTNTGCFTFFDRRNIAIAGR